MIVYAVADGIELEVFIRREDGERFVEAKGASDF